MRTRQSWRPLGSVDPDALESARIHLHDRVQWLARIARSYIPAVPDDSHTALSWDAESRALATQPISTAGGPVQFMLDLDSVSLRARPSSGDTLELSGLNAAEAESAVRAFIAHAGLDPAALRNELPYDNELVAPTSLSTKQERVELANYFGNFAWLLGDRLSAEPGVSPGRLWPHHFDLAVLISIDATGSEQDRSIGVGLSPGDGTFRQPYIYLTPWPYPAPSTLGRTPAGFRWHTQGFTALIATAQDGLVGDASVGGKLSRGLGEAVDTCRKLLATSGESN